MAQWLFVSRGIKITSTNFYYQKWSIHYITYFFARTFNWLSHVIIDDKRDVFDIYTTTSYICSHQDILCSILQTGQGKLSLFLTLTTMQCCSVELKNINDPIEWQSNITVACQELSLLLVGRQKFSTLSNYYMPFFL